jgi:hypothetical protein
MKLLLPLIGSLVILAGCTDADIASNNLSKDADYFKITRRIVFYNTQSDTNMLIIEGLCSLGNSDPSKELSVTCKTGPNTYKKHFLGLSRNVTFVVEQIDDSPVNVYHYKVVFKPSAAIPDIEVK